MASSLISLLLPLGPVPPPPKAAAPANGAPQKHPGAKKPAASAPPPPPADREADPEVQHERAICDYGWKLVDAIAKDYAEQIAVWRTAFSEVLAAFSTAIQSRDRTFERAKEELDHEAANEALVFSLLTAGAMRFLGAYVQLNVLPSIKIKVPTRVVWSDAASDLPGIPTLQNTKEFSKLQCAVFGGIVQDAGNKLLPLLFPKPKGLPLEMDSWAGINNLNADFGKFMQDSSQVVLQQFTEAQRWLRESTDFGSAWIAFASGSSERARLNILSQVDGLRNLWADTWEFYGKTPNTIDRTLLAGAYERALWAAYLVPTLQDYIDERNEMRGIDTGTERDEYPDLRSVRGAIFHELIDLNVIVPRDSHDLQSALAREASGSPHPTVNIARVHGAEEAQDLLDWANGYLKNAALTSTRQFFPPAQKRKLPPL